jgi:catechol 2,3-dioxygenase-like lactoylglutathione lyase family enzyme
MHITDSNLTIMVKDMDKSIAFYQSIGLVLKSRWENHYPQLTAPGIVIGLHPANEDYPATGHANVSIGFKADNFEEARTHLKSIPVKVLERNEEGGQFLHFSDPDGTELYFIKPKW